MSPFGRGSSHVTFFMLMFIALPSLMTSFLDDLRSTKQHEVKLKKNIQN